MLHRLLSQYLFRIESSVRKLKDVHVERYEEEIISDDRVTIRVRIRFISGCLLELNESAIVENERIRHMGYRYHFQDKENRLIFRYDDTPHFPKIETFPHHKHLQNEVIAFHKPDITKVIEEAQLFAQCPEKTLTKGDPS